MKIKEPVHEIPPCMASGWGKYQVVWKAVVAIPKGVWLPVECDDAKAANLLYLAAKTHRTHRFESRKDGNTVYVRLSAEPA